MENSPYMLELYADATIAQKGTQSEQKALREQLKSQIDSWGSVYSENHIEGLWYKLGNINLGDGNVRAGIAKFIAEERKLKGGNAGTEWERKFQIIENNIGIAEALDTSRAQETTKITETTAVETWAVKGELTQSTTSTVAQPSIKPESNEIFHDIQLPYNKRKMKLFEKEISEISRSLSRGSEKQKALALTLRDALAEKGGINVTTLQKAMKKMSSGAVVSKKGDADGFFGPLTLKSLQDIAGISATPSVSETMRPTVSETPDNLKKSPQKPTVSPVLTSPATSEKSKDTYHEDQKNLDKLYSAWKLAVKAADSLSDAAERKANAELIDVSLKALADAMADFHAKYVAGKSDAYALQNAEYLRYMNNSIALYLRGESKIGNKHYRDPIAAEAMLKNTLGTKIKAPMLPTQDQFMASLDGNTQTLIKNMLDAKMKQGKTFEEALGETLGNPTIKGAWDRVIENGFAKYEKDMAAAIEKVDRTILTSQEKSSLDQLRDMYGTAAWYNLKDQNKQKLKMVGIQLAAVALGVGGAALTATGLGAEAGVPMVIAASALVGGAITTGTTMYAEGKIYSGKELLQEGSINVGTFLVGGMLFKVVRLESVIAKIWAKWVIATEMAGNYALGVSTDQIRSQFQGVDVSLAESLKNNLGWALLPLAIRWTSGAYSKAREALARRTASRLNEAQTRQAVWDTRGANAALAEANTEIAQVRAMEPASTAAETRTVRTAAETVSRTQPEFTIPREITATDLRRMRKPINTSQPDVASAFIGADGRIWNIRKISGRSGQETLEIGPVGEPSVQSAMPIQDFVNMRNEAFRRFHSTAGVAAQPSSPSAGTTAAPVEGTPAAPERSGWATAPVESPTVVPTAASAATFEKFYKNLESKLNKLKEGEKITVGDATIALKNGEYVFKTATGEPVKFSKGADGIEALKTQVKNSLTPEQHLKNSLAKDFNTTLDKVAKKEITIGDKTYRVAKDDAGEFILEKKSNGGFAKMSEAELAALSENEIDTLLNAIFGKEASGLFNRQFKNPLSLDNPVLSKIKDSKIKDFFSAETLKKIPKYLWDNTVGHMVGELKHSLHLPGIKKAEVFRTLFTGRSSDGNLIFHGHGGHSNWMPGSAWAPSVGTLATVGLVSVGEVYANHSDDIHGTEDMINQYHNNSEFVKNYFQWIYLGWLGTAIIEAPEALGLTKKSLWLAATVVKSTAGQVGKDREPDPSYLAPLVGAVDRKTKPAREAIAEGAETAVQKTGDALKRVGTATGEYLDQVK